jgi:hypothetical protein
VILTDAERKVLAELEAAATRRFRPQDLWTRFRARPCTLLIVSVVAVTLSLCMTTLTYTTSLALGVVGSVLVLVSLAALFDSSTAFAEARARRRAWAEEQLRRGTAKGGMS